MLLINDHQPQAREPRWLLEQGMCPHYKLRFPRAHAFQDSLFLWRLQAADQQLNVVTRSRKDAAGRKEVLHG